MKTFLPSFIFILLAFAGNAQVISSFTWDSNPVSAAAVGPNALSISGVANSSAGGATGNGLRPAGTNINMVLPGSSFNVNGIDISVDFRREESQAYFFSRSNFSFGYDGNQLSVNFPLVNGGSFTTVTLDNVYTLSNDNQFHNYRFRYDNYTGKATVSVDGVSVSTYTGTAGTPLYWTGAGNVTIGTLMDGGSSNVTVLDNLVIQSVPAPGVVLPLKLLSFTAVPKGSFATLNWATTQETAVSGFVIEKSADGATFKGIKTVAALNSFSSSTKYQFTDSQPLSPSGYYRLKMVDMDGSYTYSVVKKVDISAANITVSCFPNPATDYVNLRITNDKAASYTYTVSSLDGKTVISSTARLSSGAQLVSIDLTGSNVKGILLIQVQNMSDNTKQSFKIVRQ